jgi:hypothetical protein
VFKARIALRNSVLKLISVTLGIRAATVSCRGLRAGVWQILEWKLEFRFRRQVSIRARVGAVVALLLRLVALLLMLLLMLLLTLLPLLRMWMLLIITMKRALPQRLTAHRALVTAGVVGRNPLCSEGQPRCNTSRQADFDKVAV